MTRDQFLELLKQVKMDETHTFQIPLRLGPNDAIAADLIEIAISKLDENATNADLLEVSSTMFYWVLTIVSLSNRDNK